MHVLHISMSASIARHHFLLSQVLWLLARMFLARWARAGKQTLAGSKSPSGKEFHHLKFQHPLVVFPPLVLPASQVLVKMAMSWCSWLMWSAHSDRDLFTSYGIFVRRLRCWKDVNNVSFKPNVCLLWNIPLVRRFLEDCDGTFQLIFMLGLHEVGDEPQMLPGWREQADFLIRWKACISKSHEKASKKQFIFWVRSSFNLLFWPWLEMMVSMILNDTIDGRNPAPAGMYKTQQIMGWTTNLNWCRILVVVGVVEPLLLGPHPQEKLSAEPFRRAFLHSV